MEIFLNLPPYLKEWFIFQCCGVCWLPGDPEPVLDLPRGGIESNILQTMLRAPRVGESPMIRCPEGWTRVRVPVFRGVDLASRNYLSDKVRYLIENSIRSRFDIDLWELIRSHKFRVDLFKDLLSAWMESRGIEDDETNWMAVDKRARRLWTRHSAIERQRAHRNKKKSVKISMNNRHKKN